MIQSTNFIVLETKWNSCQLNGKLSPMFVRCLLGFVCVCRWLSVSQSVSQCGVTVDIVIRINAIVMSDMLKYIHKNTVQTIANCFRLLFNLWSKIKCNYGLSLTMDYSHSMESKSVWLVYNTQITTQWKMYLNIIAQNRMTSEEQKQRQHIFQLHFCFCSLE